MFSCLYLSVSGVHFISMTTHQGISYLVSSSRHFNADECDHRTGCDLFLWLKQWFQPAAAALCFIGGSAHLNLELIHANKLLLIDRGGKIMDKHSL